MKKPAQKKKKTTGRTDRTKSHPKFTAKQITEANLELFLSVFPEKYRLFTMEYTRSWNARAAYQKIHPKSKISTAKTEGHKLLKDDKVQLYLDWLAQESNDKFEVTKEGLMKDLQDVKQQCMTAVPVRDRDGDPIGDYIFNASGANKSIELQGKEIGMFVNKVEVDDGRTSQFIVHYHVVPEIKPIDMASPKFEKDITEAVKNYIRERKKKG